MADYVSLVLNPNYTPVSVFPLKSSVIHAGEAFTRVLNGTCDLVETYDARIKTQNPNFFYKWPSVIVRKDMVSYNRKVPLKKEYLYYRDNCKCAYCGSRVGKKESTIEHVIPRAKGGSHSWENVALACYVCNQQKNDSMPTGKWAPKTRLYAPNYYQLVSNRKNFPILVADKSWIDYLGTWKAEVIIKPEAFISSYL